MAESGIDFPTLILLTGVVVVLTLLGKAALDRLGVPALIGYFGLGFLIRVLDSRWAILQGGANELLLFLAKIGLVMLLFRIGLESDIRGLAAQLRRAAVIWVGDVCISGVAGYVAAFYLLGLGWITSLIVATAFTATSVGISVAVWQGAGALKSANGELLLDLAEMDDISAVVLLALLFAVLPVLKEGGQGSLLPLVARHSGIFLIKLLAFGACCYLFSRFGEGRITAFFRRLEPAPDPMITVAGIALIVAALAEVLGFSLAIGAFFAGLVFSGDPEAVKMEASFLPLYELFSPFFFIGVGLQIDPGVITAAVGPGMVLAVVAILGKVIADGIPVFLMRGGASGLLIGASMVPRAEIAMVVMQKGLLLGDWAVPSRVFGAMVVVSAVSCIFSPFVVRWLLNRWPQQ